MFTKLRNVSTCACVVVAIAVTQLLGATQTPPSATVSTAQASSTRTPVVSVEQRIAFLEERLDLALALKDERIQSINDRSENVYKLLQLVGIIAGAALVFFSLRDTILHWKEGQRQRGIDEIVKDIMKLQKSAVEQQVRFGQLHLDQVEESPSQQFEAIKNVNDVIGVVRQTLAFRLEQEAKVAEVMEEIVQMKAEREHVKKQKLKQAVAILDHFMKMSRMQFAALTDEQYKRGLRLEGLVNDLDEFLGEQDVEIMCSLLYTCGVIAYYDNDIVEAKTYLDRAAQSHAPDHEGELATNQNYLNRFAFIHYYRALIHKNWGYLIEAQHEIEQSAKLLEHQAGEFLTPVTKAEILSYIEGNEERCRIELQGLMRRITGLETVLKNKDEELNTNQKKLRNRVLVLWGNIHFVQNAFSEALSRYIEAIKFSPTNYYALASAAQCYRRLHDEGAAVAHFRQSLDAIERSGDFKKKRERITRAVIAVIATISARACGENERQEQYTREARELLSGNLAVDGMSPKFFSPSTKRLVDAEGLLKELDS